jgi:7,8-dihydropterin-6-yl-methyl-4-(beta-D-ribofuranosyl)aminobenzene 5'-phosphate synthase
MKKWLLRIALAALIGLFLFVGVAFLRMQLARNEIRQQAQRLSASASLQIGETKTLEILPLYEQNGQDGLESGHGVSYLIRTDSATILFDLGNNPEAASPSPLEQNMERLGISLDDMDAIVLSHFHADHVGGQSWWAEKTFSPHGLTRPALGALPVYIPEAIAYPGGNLILAQAPARLAEGVATTGLITYAQPFPVWLAMPKGDEQALAVNLSGRGIVLITGCGHMGLATLLERAQAAFDAPVVGVVGGLHYGNASSAALQPEIRQMGELDPVIVALSPHDSEPPVLDAFARAFPDSYQPIQVGTTITISIP